MANTYLRRNPSGDGNQRKFTFSFWIKKNSVNPASTYSLFDCGTSSNYFHIYFPDTHTLTVKSRVSNSTAMELVSTRVFRDSSAFYNIIVAVDSTQGTAANRCKIYVNGEQLTAFNSANYGSQNLDHEIQDAGTYHVIGTNYAASSSECFDGLMSYVAFVDGTQYDASYFGETDSSSGIWKIKTSPSVTYGTNGFFLKMDTSSPGTDTSGNNNTFTALGTPTLTQDNASNNFTTLNPLIKASNQPTFTNANTTVISPSGTNARYGGTIGMTSGKYYYEVKLLGSVTNGGFGAGILNIDSFNFNSTSGISSSSNYIGATVNNNNLYIQHGGSSNDFTPTVALGSIIGHAIDMDNGYYYVHVNGVYLNSGDPTSGATGTGNVNRTGNLNYDFSTLTMVVGGSSQNVDYGSFNFGNGFFGTTAVASSNADAAGHGLFEYAVPTGYFTLNTKNLNTYG